MKRMRLLRTVLVGSLVEPMQKKKKKKRIRLAATELDWLQHNFSQRTVST